MQEKGLCNKLYYLAENCADRYYTSAIKAFVKIVKRSTTDRQIVLVNTARALKYLEDFGQRQSQLFTELEKYHLVADSLENLKSQFHFLKEATCRNVENLQQAITVQQTYTTSLCSYINNILPQIMKLEDAIISLITTEQDTIKINAPDFDPDIDGPNIQRAYNNTVVVSVQEWLASPEPELAYATNFQEETTDRDPLDSMYNNSEESHGHDNYSQGISNHTSVHHSTGQNQITSRHIINPEEISQLEEDWDNGQFADADTNLINRHNTHSESERIRKEYTKYLLDLADNQYYSKENPVNQLQYSILDPDYYKAPPRRLQTQPRDPTGYDPPPLDLANIQCWHACGRGKCALLHRHRLFGEKTQSVESRKARKR